MMISTFHISNQLHLGKFELMFTKLDIFMFIMSSNQLRFNGNGNCHIYAADVM